MEARLVKRILLNESGIFYKINIIYCAELSNAELSAPNSPRRIVLRRIVREPNNPLLMPVALRLCCYMYVCVATNTPSVRRIRLIHSVYVTACVTVHVWTCVMEHV